MNVDAGRSLYYCNQFHFGGGVSVWGCDCILFNFPGLKGDIPVEEGGILDEEFLID